MRRLQSVASTAGPRLLHLLAVIGAAGKLSGGGDTGWRSSDEPLQLHESSGTEPCACFTGDATGGMAARKATDTESSLEVLYGEPGSAISLLPLLNEALQSEHP